MATPGYSLVVPGAVTALPIYWIYPAMDTGEERNYLTMETERGKRYKYQKWARIRRRYVFHITTAAHLTAFRAMYDAVVGVPFYWVPDSAVPASYFYVRMEGDAFLPDQLDQPAVAAGLAVSRYHYTFELTGEPTDAEVDA